jgi:ATP-dependent Clp protease adaptor protein ClpS
MTKTLVKPRTKVRPKTQRPPLYKVILLNDDYTPREFVVQVLKAVFRMNADQAYRVMMTAHRRGACVIAVYTRDVAETKAKEATELGKSKGYPRSSPPSQKSRAVPHLSPRNSMCSARELEALEPVQRLFNPFLLRSA